MFQPSRAYIKVLQFNQILSLVSSFTPYPDKNILRPPWGPSKTLLRPYSFMVITQSHSQLSQKMESNLVEVLQNQVQTLIHQNEQKHKHHNEELATMCAHHQDNLQTLNQKLIDLEGERFPPSANGANLPHNIMRIIFLEKVARQKSNLNASKELSRRGPSPLLGRAQSISTRKLPQKP